jgi:hypothetical protein
MNWIDLNIPYDEYNNTKDSFCVRGLNRPGVLFRLKDGREYLVGHVNEYGGVCGCCGEFGGQEIVQAYCVVWAPEGVLEER